jgi:hypothetical protein
MLHIGLIIMHYITEYYLSANHAHSHIYSIYQLTITDCKYYLQSVVF